MTANPCHQWVTGMGDKTAMPPKSLGDVNQKGIQSHEDEKSGFAAMKGMWWKRRED